MMSQKLSTRSASEMAKYEDLLDKRLDALSEKLPSKDDFKELLFNVLIYLMS